MYIYIYIYISAALYPRNDGPLLFTTFVFLVVMCTCESGYPLQCHRQL